jgi:uncharacterized delta-60 repeat protein
LAILDDRANVSDVPMSAMSLLALAVVLATTNILYAQIATQVWATRYDGPANSIDSAYAVKVDSAGNVAVGGLSHNGSNDDYYTVKYAAADGALLWQHRYNGSANNQDEAVAIAVDGDGNVAVTGYSSNGSNFDYYTAKYAAIDGALVWEKRYNGPANSDDYAYSITVDSAGNVVVTGESNGGIGSGVDYYTAKYAAADGALVWEKRYNGSTYDVANSVAVDSSSNVVVTGQSVRIGGDNDYYTAKYAAADGTLLWEKRYNSPGNGTDQARSVAVDNTGNVIVTGVSSVSNNADYYTAKYAAANGALLWEKRYNGPANGSDQSYSVAVDSGGNVAVTGYSYNASGDADYYTAKYASADGTLLWEKRYARGFDLCFDVAVDGAGNVVVTGHSSRSGTGFDYYTAKYAAADGHLLWEARYNGPANADDVPGVGPPNVGKLALTSDGGAVVTGSSWNGTNFDYATVRYVLLPLGDADGDGLRDSWEQLWWGTIAGHSALDDFDGDGLPEIVEMAFALNPKKPDSGAFTPVMNAGGYLTLTITKQPGVAYEVQTAGTPDPSAFSPATTTLLIDDATALKVRDNFPIATNPARYLRVKVTAAP